MFENNSFSYKIENLSLWFQGGVRRGFLFFGLVIMILCVPLYFLSTFVSGVWFKSNLNPFGLDSNSYFIQKDIQVQEVIISNSQLVKLKDGSNELYLSINNKANPEVGFLPYVYDLIVKNERGEIIDQAKKATYILPGEISYIVYRSQNGEGTDLSIRQNEESKKFFYNPFSNIYKKPKIEISNTRFKERTSTDILEINFTITNNDLMDVKEVDLLYIIRDNRESIVGIGDFKVLNLASGDQKSINIPYIQPRDRAPRLVNIDWRVNYLKPNISS